MSKRTFSVTYILCSQANFEKALDEDDLETATQILESLPTASNTREAMDRLTVMSEGYRTLANAYRERRREEDEELEEYRKIGTVSELREARKVLGEDLINAANRF